MKKISTKFLLLVFILAVCSRPALSQSLENVGQYMEQITKATQRISLMNLSYLSALGHNKSARKVDKRRQELINNIFNTRLEIQGMPPWKGDRTYRDTTVAYFKLMYNVFNEDFAKIVNMEEIAEQSYDAMEAYMLAQEKASEKLHEASEKQQRTQKEFADKYNVTLIDNTSELENKSRQAGQLMKHYNEVYLIFFKAYKQEAYVMDALSSKKITSIEQSKNALSSFAMEGLEKLKRLKGYNNDGSLIVACREALQFYREEADKMKFATEFLLKEEAFAKMKKAIDSKPSGQRTQKDIDEFNKAANDINKAVDSYNNTNNLLNKERSRSLNNWNNTVKNYLDNYMPYQKKA